MHYQQSQVLRLPQHHRFDRDCMHVWFAHVRQRQTAYFHVGTAGAGNRGNRDSGDHSHIE